MLNLSDDPQTTADLRWADYEAELELQAEDAVANARKAFSQLRSILLSSPDVVGHYRAELGDIASDFLELAAQTPKVEP